MKSVTLKHYAVFREQRGLASEEYETAARTLAELYRDLAEKHGFSLPSSVVKAAVNESFTSMESSFEEGDEIVFVPPVAGG